MARTLLAFTGVCAMMAGLCFAQNTVTQTLVITDKKRTITAVADPWCPFNCDPASANPGIMVEVLKEALEPLGYRVDYQTVPWTRALAQTLDGTYDIVIAADKIEGAGMLFPEAEFACSYSAFSLKEKAFPYLGMQSLEDKRIGGTKGYHYDDAEMAYFEANKLHPTKASLLVGEDTLLRNIKKLESGRLDVLYENADVLHYTLKNTGQSLDIVRLYDTTSNTCSYGISPRIPDGHELKRIISEHFQTINESGRLNAIRARYHLD